MRYIKTAACVILLFFAAEAWGAGCTITLTPMSFGNYDSLIAASLDSTGDVSVSCDSGTPFTVKIDAGSNTRGTFSPRKMRTSTGATLGYNLYRDVARTELWGDGTNNTFVQSGTGTGAAEGLTVYGRLPGGQKVPIGLYTDMVTVTVEW